MYFGRCFLSAVLKRGQLLPQSPYIRSLSVSRVSFNKLSPEPPGKFLNGKVVDEFIRKLELVDQEIKDLLKRQAKLNEKKLELTLTKKDEAELGGVKNLLAELRKDKKFWQKEISKANSDSDELESKSFSEADKKYIESVCEVNCDYRKWIEYDLDETIQPSQRFKDSFNETVDVFHQTTEAGRRIFINVFLSDIVGKAPFRGVLKIFTEVPMDVCTSTVFENGMKRKLGGNADYTVGFALDDVFDTEIPTELLLVAVEAKCTFSKKDIWQCVAETATLYKSRKDKMKANRCVWGVLSNAETWQFIFINQDGFLFRTGELFLDIREYQEEQVLKIYRFLYYLVKKCSESSPRNSMEDVSA